jgi:uncharacterized protein (TIGR00299 family) protein
MGVGDGPRSDTVRERIGRSDRGHYLVSATSPPMTTLAFDGRTGAAGDMILGALVAAGADPASLDPVEAALPIAYELETVDRNGITATRVQVEHAAATGDEGEGDENEDQNEEHGDHSHNHSHDHGAEGHGPHRTYAEVVELVESMDLPNPVERDALAIFEILGEAEASVHGSDLADTHFHEVGADDAIADVVGACLLVADLREAGLDRIVTTPLRTGGGTVTFSHGTYPVPTPAVVEIAERADWSLQGGPIDTELLTPTGAAVLAHFADGVETLPPLKVAHSGYGAGYKQFPDHPNVLRAMVGEGTGRLVRDDITVLETNLDDAPPEVLGSLQETLQEAGARDVSVLPATMKKSRPGHLVKVICKPEDAERVAHRLAVETGTLGVREHGAGHRWVASRAFETVELDVEGEAFEVTVKVASDADGEVFDVSAEYDDALSVAGATGLAVREVMRRAEAAVDVETTDASD